MLSDQTRLPCRLPAIKASLKLWSSWFSWVQMLIYKWVHYNNLLAWNYSTKCKKIDLLILLGFSIYNPLTIIIAVAISCYCLFTVAYHVKLAVLFSHICPGRHWRICPAMTRFCCLPKVNTCTLRRHYRALLHLGYLEANLEFWLNIQCPWCKSLYSCTVNYTM